MSSAINKAGLKLFSRHLEHYTPSDPLYEDYVDGRGRTKRRKVRLYPLSPSLISSRRPSSGMTDADSPRTQRQLPPGLSDRDAAILRSVKRRAHYLDKGFNLCGIRFGWSFIIGEHHYSTPTPSSTPPHVRFVNAPQVLSLAWVTPQMPYSATSSSSVKHAEPSTCPPPSPFHYPTAPLTRTAPSRIPWWLTQRMVLNLAIATSVGLVPIVGDVVLAAFRANSRNATLLEEFLRHRVEAGTGDTSAPAERGISLREEPRTSHEASQDIDDGVMAAPQERKRPWLGTGGADDKGASTSAQPEGSQVVQHRDSRFIEDVN
jgi:hypothetical protein